MGSIIDQTLKTKRLLPVVVLQNVADAVPVALALQLAGPYPAARFVPTGGIRPSNLKDYLAVIACGGSWMVDPRLIAAGDFAAITKLTAESVALAAGSAIRQLQI